MVPDWIGLHPRLLEELYPHPPCRMEPDLSSKDQVAHASGIHHGAVISPGTTRMQIAALVAGAVSFVCGVYLFGYRLGSASWPPARNIQAQRASGLEPGFPVLLALVSCTLCLLISLGTLALSVFSEKNRIFSGSHIVIVLISLPGAYYSLSMLLKVIT